MTKKRPILFNDEMVRAILDGRKTQTRRILKLTDKGLAVLRRPYATTLRDGVGLTWQPYGGAPEQVMPPKRVADCCPFGTIGDRLWVREAWNTLFPEDQTKQDISQVCYRATQPETFEHLKAKLAIFMPRWASRITLEITGVRVERVQDISEEDARAEGVGGWWLGADGRRDQPDGSTVFAYEHVPEEQRDYRKGFQVLWDRIHVKKPGQSWANSPWVWIIEFKRITANGSTEVKDDE